MLASTVFYCELWSSGKTEWQPLFYFLPLEIRVGIKGKQLEGNLVLCVVFVNPTKLKCSGKREPQPRNCLP